MRISLWLEFLHSPYVPLQIGEKRMDFSPPSDHHTWVYTRDNIYPEEKKLHRKMVAGSSSMAWPQVQCSEQSPTLCWKNVSREKILQYAITEQEKKLLFYLHSCGDDTIVLAKLEFLSSWTWHFCFVFFQISAYCFQKSNPLYFLSYIL